MLTHTYLPKIGGREKHVAKLSEALVRRGHKIIIITSDQGSYPEQKGIQVIKLKEIKVKLLNKPMKTEYRVLKNLYSTVKKINCDIIHLHDLLHYTTDALTPYAKILDTPLVLTIHGFYPPTKILQIMVKLYHYTLGYYHFSTVNRIILPNVSLVKDIPLTKFMDKVRVIPNGVDIRGVFPKNFRDEIKILAIGRIIPRKGFLTLVKAMPLIISRIPNVHLNFVGPDGGYRFKIEESIKDLKLVDKITLKGIVSEKELERIYEDTDICVIPSTWENNPLTILEASSWGIPVISSNVGGIPKVIKHGYNGFLVPPEDPYELGQAIIKIIKDPVLYHNTSVNALKTVKSLSWDSIAEMTESIYEESLDE
jgi:glycosyltransferase involved in cell wall biosynthesis